MKIKITSTPSRKQRIPVNKSEFFLPLIDDWEVV